MKNKPWAVLGLCFLILLTCGCSKQTVSTESSALLESNPQQPETLPADPETNQSLPAKDQKENSTSKVPETSACPENVTYPQTTESAEKEEEAAEQQTEPSTEASTEQTTTPATEPPTVPVTEEPATEPPKPPLDINELIQYGIDYAVTTYGYEYQPGMRDGWYPPFTAYIPDMESGYEIIRECVDCNTETLEARGEEIVEYVDGVGYPLPIDIEIAPDPDGYEDSYLVYIYY